MTSTILPTDKISDPEQSLDIWNRGKGHTWSGKLTPSFSTRKPLSSMWSFSSYRKRKDLATRLLKHRRHIDSLCKIVNPSVRHTLLFTKKNEYDDLEIATDNPVIVDAGLLKYSDKNLDVFSGLAIHEKLHCIYSKDIFGWLEKNKYKIGDSETERYLLKLITNIIEDEYIERRLQETCSGYVHYITACKKYYFDKSDIEDESKITEFGEIINTLMLLVRYPSRLGETRRKKHAEHIQSFMKELGKGLESRKHTIRCIKNIYSYLIKLGKSMAPDNSITKNMLNDIDAQARASAEQFIQNYKDEMQEKHWKELVADGTIKQMYDEEKKSQSEFLKRNLEAKLRNPLESLMTYEHISKLKGLQDYKLERIGISYSTEKKINELEKSEYLETKLSDDLAFSSSQKLVSWQKAKCSETASNLYLKGVTDMRSEILKLKRKVDLYGNTNRITMYNQKRGRIDKRRLHRIPMGLDDLFKAVSVKQDKPLDICILVDESGSMGYNCMKDARNSAIAIKEALSDNSQLDLWVFGHSADEIKEGQTEMIEYHSPSTHHKSITMGDMKSRYENRDGNAILASAIKIENESENNGKKLMIVLSDGQPSANLYRGEKAISHTRDSVKYVEKQGWEVIQVGFGQCTDEVMSKMFTNYVRVDDTSNLGNKLSKIIRKVLKI